MTFGTLAGMMAADAIAGPHESVDRRCSIRRARASAALWDYVKENKDYPYYLVRDRFAGTEGKSLRVGAARLGQGARARTARRSRCIATSGAR